MSNTPIKETPSSTPSSSSASSTSSTPASKTTTRAGENDLEAQVSKLREDVAGVADSLKALAGNRASNAKDQAFALRDDVRETGEKYLRQAQEAAGDFEEEISQRVRAEPIKAVLIAAAVGYFYARIFKNCSMLTQLITKLFTGEAGVFFARMRVVALLYAAMALVGMAMLGFLLAALFIWLASIYGSFATALGFAVLCLVTIVVLYVLLIFARRPPKQRASDRLQRDVASIASVAALSNLPLILRSFGRNKRLIFIPIAAAGIFGATRVILGFRRR